MSQLGENKHNYNLRNYARKIGIQNPAAKKKEELLIEILRSETANKGQG